MKINFDAPILDLYDRPLGEDGIPLAERDGTPVPRYNQVGEVVPLRIDPMTLKSLAIVAATATFNDETTSLSVEDKTKRFELAMKSAAGGEQEMRVEQVALLKKLIGKAFGPLQMGRAYEIIESSMN